MLFSHNGDTLLALITVLDVLEFRIREYIGNAYTRQG